MLRSIIGQVGHSFVILAFVSALVAALSYYLTNKSEDKDFQSWRNFARIAFFIHALSVLGIVVSLFTIIYNHYYEYHYAWSHSSNNLPTHYMISCFWEGQEGSFLLWIFWHVCLGLILIKTAKKWEASVMTVFSLVQGFLTSMILGVVIFNLKIGSSPFLLLREAMDAPIFEINPDFIPVDGTGLNALLQNYWMVIHPPTLFLGFALVLVPFAFCIAGLQNGLYKEWLKPAFPWALVATLVLGIGIMMGGYWAYETLNFEGYWNWDPVENAVYIPWIVLVGAVHLFAASERRPSALKAAIILTISSFILILYSTFLTRSGILGESSVHSFTDLGLSGQLLLYLKFFIVMSIFFVVRAWRFLPKSKDEASVYSGEFWIFIGATTLCLAGFQVLVPTSIPVYNAILESIGIESNLAPPSEQVAFYTKFQFWFGLAIALFSGLAQVFWWNRLDKSSWWQAVSTPFMVSMIVSAGLIILVKMQEWQYILLLTAAIFAIVSNAFSLVRLSRRNFVLSGGAVAHIGVSLMLIGVLASSGYSKIVSLNTSGLLYSRDFSEEMNRDNLLLFRNQPQKMKDYTLLYKGIRVSSEDFPTYIDKENLRPTNDPFKMIVRTHLEHEGEVLKHVGDTIQVYNENEYYEIDYTNEAGKTFTLFPRIQENEQMGVVTSPDIKLRWDRDLYTHITGYPDPEKDRKWSDPEDYILAVGDTFIVNDYISILKEVVRGKPIEDEDIIIYGVVEILDKETNYIARPGYQMKGNYARGVEDMVEAVGAKFKLKEIKPEDGKFVVEVQTTQKDWIILKAVEKPFINILWIGTLIMALGIGIAAFKRK